VKALLLYLLVVFALVALFLIWIVYRRNRNWRRFAVKYRFNYSQGKSMKKPVVYGEIQGRPFRLWKTREATGPGTVGLELVEMSMGILGYVPAGLEVSKRPVSQAAQDPSELRSGDAAFDQVAVVKGETPAEVIRYLSPERRNAILEMLAFDSADWAGIRGERAILIDRRMVGTLEDVERRFQFLFDLVKRLDA